MKNLAIIIITLFTFNTTQAQLLASLTSQTQGGVMGKVKTLKPQIGFYETGTALMSETMIFENAEISMDNKTMTYSMTATNGDENFKKFVTNLTSGDDIILKIGHKINGINNHVGKTVTEWFEVDLEGKEIGKIEFIVNKVDFAIPGANRTNDGNWTDFLYEITINIYGKNELMVQN